MGFEMLQGVELCFQHFPIDSSAASNSHTNISQILSSSFRLSRLEMAVYEPNSRHLWNVLTFCSSLKKSGAETHLML